MNRKFLHGSLWPLFALLLLVTSCAPKIPFTQEVRQKYKLSEADLKSIQFYASHDIVLFRGEKTGTKKTDEGTLKVSSNSSVEKVIIKAGTPGVVEKVVDGSRLAISFETGEGKLLIFGDPTATRGVYKLMAAKWVNGKGQLLYGGQNYYTPLTNQHTYLEFRLKREFRKQNSSRVAKGRKL
ncbi:MAG: hypothetical protein ACFB10_01160 [Salibacteraceae bacterium]